MAIVKRVSHFTYEFPNGVEVNPALVAFILKDPIGELNPEQVTGEPVTEVTESEPIRSAPAEIGVETKITDGGKTILRIYEEDRGYSVKPHIKFCMSGLPGDYVQVEFDTRAELTKSLADYKRAAASGTEY